MKETLSLLQGDAIFLWNASLSNVAGMPSAWDPLVNSGLGQSSLNTLWITSYLHLTALVGKTGLSWNEILILFWLLPALLIGFFSASALFGYLLPSKKNVQYLAGFFYLVNTYYILIFFGGQIGVSLAYAFVPLVLLHWNKLFVQPTVKQSLLTGLILSLQLLFDPRIVVLSLLLVIGIYFFHYFSKKQIRVKNSFFYLFPFVILLVLHNYWILPLLLFTQSSSAPHIVSSDSFRFFSFADFSHAISLLHPNWPENIFGKISFMRPEFLLLPIVAFSSLLFLKNSKQQQKVNRNLKSQLTAQVSNDIIIFFSLLSLVGAFLAKGTNEPFGGINIWLFEHIPGMNLYRDPTKWYILIALSFSILLPFTLSEISFWIKTRFKKKIYIFSFWVVSLGGYLFLLLSPFVTNNFSLLTIHEVPKEYQSLKTFLSEDDAFFRTLWVPKKQRYAYVSSAHPALGVSELYGQESPDLLLKKFLREDESRLQQLSIKYVIIPLDSEEEIFLDDRKYSEKEYRKVVDSLNRVTWLTPAERFGKIVIYEVKNPKDHFWIDSKEGKISSKMNHSTEYHVVIKNVKKGERLIFSETFDPGWVATRESNSKNQEVSIQSEKYQELNSFRLSEDGSYSLKIIYQPQMWVERGVWISLSAFLLILSMLFFLKKKNN